jgi:predicted O-methyltransferase YrrM
VCPSASPRPLTNLPPAQWAGHATGRRLIFLHIPKTAGTAVASVLTQWFGVDEIMPCSLAAVRAGSHPVNALASRRFRLFGIGMHLDHDQVAAIRHALRGEERPFVFTLLRDPRARLISQYQHWRRTDDASLAGVDDLTREAYVSARELPLGDFLASRHPLVLEHFRNYQARLLAGLNMTRFLPDDVILETALANIDGYDLVGTTSQGDDLLAFVAAAYGWSSPSALQAVNVSPTRSPPRYDDATEAAIAEYTALDAAVWQSLHAVPTSTPKRTLSCYHEVDHGIQESLLGDGLTRFSMRQQLDGSGWHVREGDVSQVRWTGPGRRSVIRLSAPRSRHLAISIQVICALDWAIVDGLTLTLDGLPPVAALGRAERDGYPTIEADFLLADAAHERRELVIEVPFTRSHADIDPALNDDRQKGLAVGEIVVSVRGTTPPSTLGELFWPGESWSAQPTARLLELIAGRGFDPLQQDTHRDLPFLAALLDLIAPRHVMADDGFRALRRGTPARSRGERIAIVASLFKLFDQNDTAATLASRHKETVLLLAMAEDPRLRALVTNPLLVPHLHMVGCSGGLLIASLDGMQRAGGVKLMEGFLWLLERIGGTTPEKLAMPMNAMDRLHVALQLRLTLAAVVAAAADAPESELRSAILATLLPEDATPPSLAIVRSKLSSLRVRSDTLLELVDPDLLDSLEQAIAEAEKLGDDSAAASPSILVAHEKAFRLLGMLSGWREWGLKTNATAALAWQLAAARQATHLLSDAQRQLAARVLRMNVSRDVGMIRPKPLKPWREYRDFQTLEASRSESASTDTVIGSRLGEPRGESAQHLEFAARVQTVEETLRRLGEQFPNEEIVWVDAGCGNGRLLAAVEPPQNIRSRRRFIGIDSSPAAIEAARVAAAAVGRSHCRFEAGDMTDTGLLAGGGRIHLITAFSVLEQCADPLAVLKSLRVLQPACLLVSPARAEPQGLLPSPTDLWTWDSAGFFQLANEADFEPLKFDRIRTGPAATASSSQPYLYLTPRATQSHSRSGGTVRLEQPSPPSPQTPQTQATDIPSLVPALPAAASFTPSPSASPGAPSMIAAMPSPCLTDADFFARHYSRLSGWLNAFAHARHRATTSGDQAAALAELVALSNRIAAEGLTIVSGTPTSGESAGVREFFGIAARLRDALRQSPIAAHVAAGDELEKHLDYFHHNIPDAALETAIQSEPASIYVRECVANCIHVLTDRVFNGYQWSCPDPRKVTDFFDTTAAEAAITPAARTLMTAVTALEGWCSPQKSLLLYSLARAHKPQTVVEIGIYGGRSIVPIAAALKDNGVGQVYGIETWSGSAAVSYRTNIANDFWWQNIDFSKLKGDFLQFVVQHQLQDTIRVVEAASDRCGGLFDRIDMLHIDGGHSTYGAAQDVVNYVSKVPSGGIIVYDDINWPSTAAGLDILRDSCRLLHVVPAFGSETEPGCAAFVKV